MQCRKVSQQCTLPHCRKICFHREPSLLWFCMVGMILFSIAIVFPVFLSSVMFLYTISLGQWGRLGKGVRQKETLSQGFVSCPCIGFSGFFLCCFIFGFFVFFFLLCSWHLHFLEEWKKIYFFNTEFHLSP